MMPHLQDGVGIRGIQDGSPASKSDLRAGDVITSVDGKPVATSEQLKSEVRSKKVGQQVALDVVRNGKNLKVKLKTDAFPEETTVVTNGRRGSAPDEATHDLGLTVKTLPRELASQFAGEGFN